MHPSTGMGIERKLPLFLWCLIPIYGLSTGRNDTNLIKSPSFEEYENPSYSLSIFRPRKREFSEEIIHHGQGLMDKRSQKRQRSVLKYNNERKSHTMEYTDSLKHLEGSRDPYKNLVDAQSQNSYFEDSQIQNRHLKERHAHHHRSAKNAYPTGYASNSSNGRSSDQLHFRRRPDHKDHSRLDNIKYRRHNMNSELHPRYQHLPDTPSKKKPFFGVGTTATVITQIDGHAFLPCVVHDLEDQTVSWIRNRDAHILTVNRYTFISGKRFVSWFEADSNTWTLQIKFINEKDAGSYECQLSTEPKMSHFVKLTVIVPKVTIPGGRELYVRKGSDISLKCVISNTIQPPPYVFWYYGNDEFNRRVVHQATVTSRPNKNSVATLVLKNAARVHAGNYTCAPSGISRSTSVMLHVLNGEHPAAMQTSGDISWKLEKILIALSATMILVENKYIGSSFS